MQTIGREIVLFYSRVFSRNEDYACAMADELRRRSIVAHAKDICNCGSTWQRLGLRSLPAIVIYENGRALANIIKYASADEILKTANAIWNDTLEPEDSLLQYDVVGSSGCHRYERWNEQFLTSGNEAVGWAAANRAGTTCEFLEIKFRSEVNIVRMTCSPRVRQDGTPSYKSFPKGIRLIGIQNDGNELPLFECSDIGRVDVSLDYNIEVNCVMPLTGCKIEIIAKNLIDGKSFPSFSRLRFWGKICHGTQRNFYKRSIRSTERGDLFYKSGLFASAEFSVVSYKMVPGQSVPKSNWPCKVGLFVVEGHCDIVFEDHSERVVQNTFLGIDSGVSFGVSAPDSSALILVMHPNASTPALWEAR